MSLIPTNTVTFRNLPDLEKFRAAVLLTASAVDITTVRAECHNHDEIYKFARLIGKAEERGATIISEHMDLNRLAH